MKNICTLFVLGLLMFSSACAPSRSGSYYTREQARQEMHVTYGTITDVRPVVIEGTKSWVGTVAGGVTGGVLGSMVGGGKGRILGSVLGALGGALGGSLAEEGITRKNGLELTVQQESGGTVTIVQEDDAEYHVGDRVRILRGNDGSARVRW